MKKEERKDKYIMQNNKNYLIPLEENSIIQKVICFFKRLFFKNKYAKDEIIQNENNTTENIEEVKKRFFAEEMRVKQKEKEKIDLHLLEQYRNGDIDEEEMTDEQFECLCNTYKEKIAKLKESNQNRKNKLFEYRRKMQTNN